MYLKCRSVESSTGVLCGVLLDFAPWMLLFFANHRFVATHVDQFHGRCFPSSVCWLHGSGSHFGDSCHISNVFIIIIYIVAICDRGLQCYQCNCLGCYELHPYKTQT